MATKPKAPPEARRGDASPKGEPQGSPRAGAPTRRSSKDFSREASVVRESVERRTDRRGPVRHLEALLPGGETVEVLEAGQRGIFLAIEDPDRFSLGARLEVTISGRGRKAVARGEVVRKEIDPRRGLALLIVHMSPTAAEEYKAMLE
jgi:hypothetical protein